MAQNHILTVSQIAALAGLFERAQSATESQYLGLLGDLAAILDSVTGRKIKKHVDMGLAEFMDSAAETLPRILADNTVQLVAFPAAAARFAKAMTDVMATVSTATKG